MSKIVIALGGNALGNTPKEQEEKVLYAAKAIVSYIKQGHEVVVAHGNGPQVGTINLAFENSFKQDVIKSSMPLAECTAMSQGYIGFHLQKAIRDELKSLNIDKQVATLVTEVVVDEKDPAFNNPTKPIGMYYTKEEAEKLHAETGDVYIEDAGRGYRKVVASPSPVDIHQIETVKLLSENNHVVITVGGGGIPVVGENTTKGVSAVIDKDKASACLADKLNADYLLILTAVDKVAINFNKENQEFLDTLNVEKAREYIKEGQFAKGSMLPKVEAALSFVENRPERKAVIANLLNADTAIYGSKGTVIHA